MNLLMKHKYKIAIVLIIVLTTVISARALLSTDEPVLEPTAVSDEGHDIVEIDYYDYVDTMHKMANTKIIPVDGKIWGEEEITSESVELLINSLLYDKVIPEYKKNELLNILYRWEEEDFSKCVSDHNYLWEILGGTVGKAIALKDGVIKK